MLGELNQLTFFVEFPSEIADETVAAGQGGGLWGL
jgi:hypothetical protein